MFSNMEQTENIPRCLIIGAGGVGVITAYSLYHRNESEVCLVTRSDYEHVQKQGYQIESCDYGQVHNWRPHELFKTVDNAAESGKFFDYIVLTTKNIPDGPSDSTVHAILKPVIESNYRLNGDRRTNIVLIQNGIDIEKEVLSYFDENKYQLCLLSGVQLIASTKVGPGHIVQKGQDNVQIGPFDRSNESAGEQAKKFVSIYHNEGHNMCIFDENVRETRWKKLLYNAAVNTTTALVGLDVTRCFHFAVNKESTENAIFIPAMEEIIAIAASEDIVIDKSLIKFFNDVTRDIIYRPSMCVDLEHNRLMELEIILGNPIRIARANGVKTPTLDLLYHLLVLVQNKLKEQKKLIEFNEDTLELLLN